jgi:hypothetical protein
MPVAAGGAPQGSWAPEPTAEGERPGRLPEGVHGTVSPPATTTGTGGGGVVGGQRGSGRNMRAQRVAGRRSATVPAIRSARGRRAGVPADEPPTDAAGYLAHGAPGPFGVDDGTAPPVIGG